MNAYMEEFHKLSLKSKRQEEESEKVARHLNDLRMNIQDEINILAPEIVNKCFQLVLRVEEKLKRISEKGNRGKGGRFSEAEAVLEEEVLTKGLVVSLAKEIKLGTQVEEEDTMGEDLMEEVGQMDQGVDLNSLV